MIMKAQYEDKALAGFYNVGPDDRDCITTGQLVDLFCEKWNQDEQGENCVKWINKSEINAPHEANFLKLDCSKIKKVFGWKPRWGVAEAVEKTVKWYLENQEWLDHVTSGDYQKYYEMMYK